MGWRILYEWTRAIFAVIGAMLVAFFALLCLVAASAERAEKNRPADPLQGAWLLRHHAGLANPPMPITLVRAPPEGIEGYGDAVEAWCLRAKGLPLDRKWVEARALPPLLAATARVALDQAHAEQSCVPASADAAHEGMRLRPMELRFVDGRPVFVELALYDKATGALYLLSVKIPEEESSSTTGATGAARAFD